MCAWRILAIVIDSTEVTKLKLPEPKPEWNAIAKLTHNTSLFEHKELFTLLVLGLTRRGDPEVAFLRFSCRVSTRSCESKFIEVELISVTLNFSYWLVRNKKMNNNKKKRKKYKRVNNWNWVNNGDVLLVIEQIQSTRDLIIRHL